jgi:hypothetical protein
MEGSGVMATRVLSYDEQLVYLTDLMKEKIEKLTTSSKSEADKEAEDILFLAGMTDEAGNLVGPYAEKYYVQ